MALALAVLTFILLCGFCLGFACLGNSLLRVVRLELPSNGRHLLVAVAVGLLSTEFLIFLLQPTQHIFQGCLAILALLVVFLLREWKSVWARFLAILQPMVSQSAAEKSLLLMIAIVAAVEFLASQAPLTGSDALHYHFTAQKEILQHGFHPLYSNSLSFLCGQHHLLILLGLALGAERLALGFIFLGGILTSASLACLASQWTSSKIASAFVLLFLLTPVVFWQMSCSGSPDILMAFLASTTLMVLCQQPQSYNSRQILLAGFLAGGVAGAKYTGCLIAAAFLTAVFVEARSAMQTAVFLLGSLLSGVWPYLRNFMWTGDPVFPFFSSILSPHLTTPSALQALASNTGASSTHRLSQLVPFLLLAAAQKGYPGFWDFFGPAVLLSAPLIFLAFRNTRPWRTAVLVWILSGALLYFASGLPRFLLPVFPIALSCAAAGLGCLLQRKWKLAQTAVVGLLFLSGLAGLGGFAIYMKDPLRVAIGLQKKEDYLRERGPEYQAAHFVNQTLGQRGDSARALVFLRHSYYLGVPYINGDPQTSFLVDPERLLTPQDWKSFFAAQNIGYVVKSPAYPSAIEDPLQQLENSGVLVPIARAEVDDFQGKRIEHSRARFEVVILQVISSSSSPTEKPHLLQP